MKSKDAARMLAEITAYQWGMVTSAQANTHGITRLELSRLTADGQLERLMHGVYRDAGSPAGPHDDLKAAWLSTDPKVMGEARIKHLVDDVVVAGESAANLHGIGDFHALGHEFVSPTRRQSQRPTVRYRQRSLDPRDVTLVDGLPVMTMERTIADLVDDVGDLSLVADTLRDAARKRELDLERVRSLLSHLAQRHGLGKGDGAGLLDRLMEIAGIDPEAVARRVAADASLGSRVAANYLVSLGKHDLDRLVVTPEVQQAVRSIHDAVAAAVQRSLAPQLAGLNAAADRMVSDMVTNMATSSGLDEVASRISAQLADSDAMRTISHRWATALVDGIARSAQTGAADPGAQEAVAR